MEGCAVCRKQREAVCCPPPHLWGANAGGRGPIQQPMSRLRTRGCCPRGTPGGIWSGPFPTITTQSPPLQLPPGSPSVPLWPPFPVLATRSRGVGWSLLGQPRMPLKGRVGAADCKPHPTLQGDCSQAPTDRTGRIQARGCGTGCTWAGAKEGVGVPCRPALPPSHHPRPPSCTRHMVLPVLALRAVSPLARIPTWLHSLRGAGGGTLQVEVVCTLPLRQATLDPKPWATCLAPWTFQGRLGHPSAA